MSNLLLLLAGCGSESQIIDLDQDGFNADVDCNDGDENIHPLAAESCDEVDHNCDGSFYEGFTSETYFLDADGDGFGDASQTVSIFCEASPPEGYVANADDCDDDNDEVKPGQLEFCDGIDNNCVDGVDENSAEDVRTWYFDGDGDGYGLEDVSETSCYAPESYTEEFGDCNDDDINTNPDAIEECADGFDKDCDGVIIGVDGDGDGLSSCEGDCDDTNINVNPSATEFCNNIDDNCNTLIDEPSAEDAQLWTIDSDSDGFGDVNQADTQLACDQPVGYVLNIDDCDDGSNTVFPGATEFCNDIDDDCDTLVDESAVDADIWYLDGDSDGFGGATNLTQCDQPVGYVLDGTDCDDGRDFVYPGASELCDGLDNDCDFATDEDPIDGSTYYEDFDSDGFGNLSVNFEACSQPAGFVVDNTDCDDTANITYPGADEICDGEDNDCNVTIDDNPVDGTTYYLDSDSDLFGDANDSIESCTQPGARVLDNTDCDDANNLTYPGADEICDGEDNNCNVTVDENPVDGDTYYEDFDIDGFGNPNESLQACSQPAGHVSDDTDCDDTTNITYPGADEICDGEDNDCNVTIDDNPVDGTTYYLDSDSDLFGDANDSIESCTQPGARVLDNTDCDDANNLTYPGADEICDGEDNNCNVTVDENPVDGDTYYQDFDNDSYGDPNISLESCTPVGGYALNNNDCNDTDAVINPTTEWYADGDGDGHGAGAVASIQCDQPVGEVLLDDDCNDAEPLMSPGLTEVCGDWLDNDCDGGPNQCVQPSQMFATSAAYKVHGETMTAEAAYSSALIPDINGDGLMEHVVGARQDLVTAGISYFMMSPLTPGDDYTGNYDLQVMGRYSQDSMGQVVEDCSFIDGDGLGDVCMGSPLGRDTLSDPMVGVGHIMTGANIMSVLPGPAGRVSTDATIRRIVGQNEGDLFAFSIAGHFDFEGNGTSDVMFGAPGHDNGSGTSTDDYGAAYLESGYPASNKTADPATSYAFFHGTRLSERAGIRVAGAGDLDADGTDEVAISNELSEIHLYYGDTLTPGVQALAGDAVFLGEGPDDYAGLAISHGRHQMKTSGTTLNGDQYDDFVIAAPNADPLGRVDAGKVYVVFGDATKRSGNIDLGTITSNNGMEILGPSDGFLLGLSVAVMGDHDGDGVADLLIGSLAGPTEVGQAIIIKGPLVAGTTIDLATDTPDTIIDGNDAGDRFGFHVGGGDYDGDGYYEAVTGAYKSDEGGTTGAGTAIIHSAPGL